MYHLFRATFLILLSFLTICLDRSRIDGKARSKVIAGINNHIHLLSQLAEAASINTLIDRKHIHLRVQSCQSIFCRLHFRLTQITFSVGDLPL